MLRFADIVYRTSGFRILPLNEMAEEDAHLVNDLALCADLFMRPDGTNRRVVDAKDARAAGDVVEKMFVKSVETETLSAKRLPKSGYPDSELIDRYGRLSYLECKTGADLGGSSARTFYYSNGSKIKQDARHLLIGWEVTQVAPRRFAIHSWKLVDLFHLDVRRKIEYNSDNLHIYSPEMLVRTSPQEERRVS